MDDRPVQDHLQPHEVSGFMDGNLTGDGASRVAGHLAVCGDCRDEVVEVSRALAAVRAPRPSRRWVWVPAAAAAALLLFVNVREHPDAPGEHREAPVTATIAPTPVAPTGTVDSVATITWTAVPASDRYRVRVFSTDGSVLWERETTDTSVSASAMLRRGRAYYWKVEAYSGFGRSASSALTPFEIRR